MYDLGGDPLPAAGGYFGQARTDHSDTDGYRQGRWESHQKGWPPQSDGSWSQSWDQARYSDYLGGQPPASSYDWQRLYDWHRSDQRRLRRAVKPYRPFPIRSWRCSFAWCSRSASWSLSGPPPTILALLASKRPQ
jgi:hypothetical protein